MKSPLNLLNVDREGRAAARLAVDVDGGVVPVHDPPDQAQTQANALI
jgi:hypothetical protein